MSKTTPEELPKLTNEECIEMRKVQKRQFWKNRDKTILKLENEKMEKQIIRLKKDLHTIKRRR